MKKVLLPLICLFITQQIFSQGCTVTGSSPSDTIVCGDRVLLSAHGQAQGNALLSENFNTGTYGPGWASTQQAMFTNPCGPNTVDGTTYIWMGNSSPVPRILTTAPFNLSSCAVAGVTICFDMRYSVQGDNAPCEGPDLPAEGVYLQYSIDNGATWVTINYQDPNGGYDPQLTTWNNYCFPVPPAALTPNVQFRWYQDNDSGADYDHWGIDNVVIYCNDPSYNIVWQHDGYNLGPVGGTDPNPVAPHTTTSYVVDMSNGTQSCHDTVTIVVVNPTISLNAGNDTSICNGQCLTLNATAKIVKKPAKTPTYHNQETATISGTPGFPGFPPFIPATPGTAFLSMDLNITNLNLSTVPNNYVTGVCIGSLNMILFAGIEIFEIWLVCPSGDSILLVPDSTLTGNTLTNTCFVPAGSNITSASSPYTGSYAPNQSFNGLAGCGANGVWSLHLVAVYNGITLPTGNFNSWSISFNDPEIAYTGNFNWNPTTGMTNPLTLSPTVCPPPTAYTLTVSDTAGCVTQNDVINVTTHACCGLSAAVTQVPPTCGGSNGTINVTPVPAGTYSFAWSDGSSTLQNRTGLGAGSYTVTVTDVNTPTCTFDTTITLNSNSTLNVSLTNPVNPTCAGSNGSITFSLSGGTAPYVLTIDTNGTSFVINSPFAIPATVISNVPAGAVSISVTDGAGCTATANAVLVAPVNCCGFTVSAVLAQPTCGQSNGGITLTPAGGTGTYTYAWGGGQNTSSVTNVAAATYSVTITDTGFPNCFIDTTFTLNSNSTLNVSLTNPTNPTCAGSDGSITFTLSGGTAPYVLTIDTNGTSFVINSPVPIPATVINNVPAGAVNISVTDNAGCIATANAVLVAPANCCAFTVSAALTQPACAQTNGDITITTTNGSGNYTYVWGGGQNTALVSNLGAGNYPVTITDNAYANCFIDTSFSLSNPNAPTISNVVVVNETCAGNNDGSITVTAGGGTGVLSILWSNGANTFTITNLAPGNYDFTITDGNSCAVSQANTITAAIAMSTITTTTNATCYQAPNGSATTNPTGGATPYIYAWSNAGVTNAVYGLAAGAYTCTVTDQNGCSVTASGTVTEPTDMTYSSLVDDVKCIGQANGVIHVSSAGGTSPYSYSATQDGSNFIFADSTGAIPGLAAGTYIVIYSDNFGCTKVDTVIVNDATADVFVTSTDSTSCFGAQYNDGAGHIVDVSVQNEPYQYSIDGGALQTSGDFYSLSAGNHSIHAVNFNGCGTDNPVTVLQPAPVTVSLGNDTTLCLGLPVLLDAGSGYTTYLWSTNEITQTIVPLAAGVYTVIVTNANGCSAMDDVNVNFIASPIVDLGEDKIAYEGTNVGLWGNVIQGATNGGTYNWMPDTLLSCSTCQNTVAYAADTLTYTLTYTDVYGCPGKDDIIVYVLPVGQIFFPNAFTPTGDGNNDIYIPFGNAGVKQINWSVYNRWGEKVFESDNFYSGWDGYYKGAPAPMGVYVYSAIAVLMDNTTKKYKGSVTLIR